MLGCGGFVELELVGVDTASKVRASAIVGDEKGESEAEVEEDGDGDDDGEAVPVT